MRKPKPTLLLTSILVTACGSSGPTELVKHGAILAGVSVDRASIASFASATRQPNGTYVGALQVQPTAGGAAIALDPMGGSASFARGTTLYYLGGVTIAQEGTPPLPRAYGALHAWLPTQPAPVALGALVATSALSQDGSTIAYVDQDAQGEGATASVKAWSAGSCGAAGCGAPITVATGVTASKVALRVSDDGTQVLVGIARGGATPASIVLVSFPAGTMQTLSSAMAARSAMLSRDGATAAWVEGVNELHVAPTATPTTTTTIAVTTAAVPLPIVESAAMIDATHFVVKSKATMMAATSELDQVSAGVTTPLGVTGVQRMNVVAETPSNDVASTRWLFYSTTTAANGQDDLWLLDLQNPTTPPVELATTAAATSASFSDDAGAIHFFDAFDPVTREGDLYTMTLPGGAKTAVATGVRQVAWEPGTEKLLYIAAPDATTGAGALTLWENGASAPVAGLAAIANYQQSRLAPDLYYTSLGGNADDGVWMTDEP